MEQLIPMINKLQDVFNETKQDPIDLPQIAVIGSQSTGKSSVLENIVHRDFLPRGSDIVTRRPLVLQLINLPKNEGTRESEIQEWGEFLHLPDKTFNDFDEIRKEIERETARVAGSNKGVSSHPIQLRIFSPHVLNLTMIDLPGITKVPVGDQPRDIEAQIRNMVMEYINKPNCIILAVSAANVDIANSEALKLAREVDPEGNRTIGVLTKLDLMDVGTDCMDILSGRKLPLKLGYVGVVNRSQYDINHNKSIKAALRSEREYFEQHPLYVSLLPRCGTEYLASTMNKILIHHIRERLPELRIQINSTIVKIQEELESYGDIAEHQDKGQKILALIDLFSSNFNGAIDGTLPASTQELCGGARINFVFNDIYGTTLATVDPCAGLSEQDIRTAIRNSTGPRPALFIPEMSFEILVKAQIQRLLPPSMRCVELVYDELQRIMAHSGSKQLGQYPTLQQRMTDVGAKLVRKRVTPTTEMIKNLIDIELSYINTNHPDFMGGTAALAVYEQARQNKAREEQERANPNYEVPALPRRGNAGVSSNMGTPTQSRPPQIPTSGINNSNTSSNGKGLLSYIFGSGNPAQAQATNGRAAGSSATAATGASANQGGGVDMQMPPVLEGNSYVSEREEMETILIRSLIFSYFSVVRKNVQDLIPKTIMHFLVNYMKSQLRNHLMQELYHPELFDELLQEDTRIQERREKCRASLDVYQKAARIVNEISEENLI